MSRKSLSPAPLRARLSATTTLSVTQKMAVILMMACFIAVFGAPSISVGLRLVLGVGFLAAAAFRLCCVATVLTWQEHREEFDVAGVGLSDEEWPTYTVVLALYREANMVPTLLKAVHALDYPQDRIEILIAAEADDLETIKACLAFKGNIPLRVVYGAGDAPKTKPRALNAALKAACGEIIVVYDAEDQPHKLQLKEAASRFLTRGGGLGVVQAPLRILVDPAGTSLEHHFSIDYAALFEVTLPALARAGWPFPLGGSSNHFRRSALVAVGGWDPWNVTEDADIGFELARLGYRSELLRSPTFETAPRTLWPWIKQRSRWIKGHMQTLKVHTRRLCDLNFIVGLSLMTTLFVNLASAASTGPIMLVLIVCGLREALQHHCPHILPFDMHVFLLGWGAAIVSMGVGSWRAGIRAPIWHYLLAPIFWAAQSVAFVRAVHQLLSRPYHWDKTDHVPLDASLSVAGLDGNPPFGLSGGGDHTPPPHRA